MAERVNVTQLLTEEEKAEMHGKAVKGVTADKQIIDGITFRQAKEISFPESEPWEDPEPIQDGKLLPVEALPEEILPEELRPWLVDISFRMQCPLDFVAAGCLVALSSVIGAGCSIRPKKRDDWSIVPNLWGGIVARPSMLKTPALTEVLKPLNRLESEAKKEFDNNQAFFAAERESHKAVKTAIISEMTAAAKGKAKGKTLDGLKLELAGLEEPTEPVRRRYKSNDCTVEKLGELLNENPRGLLIFRDELTGLLASWDREDRVQDRAFYLESWNGNQSFVADRIGRGTIDTANCCLSILGGIQPSKLLAYLLQSTDSLRNDGMVQRFQILVYPDEPDSWNLIDQSPDNYAKARAFAVFERLANMNFITAGAEPDDARPFFQFDVEAQQIFYEWLTEHEIKIRCEENPLIAEHLGKYRSLMPSLSLILHLAGGGMGRITVRYAMAAAAWCEYLESHARRIYGLLSRTSEKAAAALAAKIQKKEIENGFTLRDVYRKGWNLLDTRERVEAACKELEELGWIRTKLVAIAGRQAVRTFDINPKIFYANA